MPILAVAVRRVLQGVILHTATRGSFFFKKNSFLRQLFSVFASYRVNVGSNKRN